MMRLYRLLAMILLPAPFRGEYGEEIVQSVGTRLSEARGWGRPFLFCVELADLVRTSIREWRWEWGRRGGCEESVRAWTREMDRSWRDDLDALWQDLRYALRQIRRAPGFSTVLVLTLAVGIGLNTTVFSGVHALLLRPLAGVEDPGRLVHVFRSFPGSEHGANSIPHYRDLRDRGQDVFDGVAAWSFVTLTLGADAQGQVIVGQMVSANFFEVLGVRPALGRTFTPEEAEGPGAHPVVVLSHEAWRGRFAGDPDVLGRTLLINGRPFSVVGVAPEGFRGVTDLHAPMLWAPLVMQPWLQPLRPDRSDNRNSNFMSVVARLRPSATVEMARAGAQRILAGLLDDHPDTYEGTGIRIEPQGEIGIGPSFGSSPKQHAILLMSVVALLMLLACANVANMLMSRAEQRRREIAIRIGVGAGRARIVRQLLTEGLLLAMLAGLSGLALAAVAIPFLERIDPPTDLPLSLDLELSPPVLTFTLLLGLGTVLLFGLFPALLVTKSNATGGVAGIAARAAPTSALGHALVIGQTALAVLLLFGAATFLRSLVTATAIEPGFRAAHLLTARIDPGLLGYDRAASEEFMHRLAEAVEAVPGVTGFSWSDALPLGLSSASTRIAVRGYDPGPDAERLVVDYARVGPEYLETMGIRLLRGRGISAADDGRARDVVVVNEAMADRFWPGTDALGRIVEAQGSERVVVGITETGKYRDLREDPTPFMYLPLAQDFRSDVVVVVRSTVEPDRLAPVLRRRVAEVDPAIPIHDVRTMDSVLGVTLFPARVATSALALFGAIGLLSATLGIYGVLSHWVSRQTREIGVRLALGAKPANVLSHVLLRGMRLVATGVLLGVACVIPVSETLRGLIYTERVIDPPTLAGVAALLGLVATIAIYAPARAAARVDPLQAMMSE